MNEGTYIISDNEPLVKSVIGQLNLSESKVIYSEAFANENDFHDWSTQLFKNRTLKKLIIPLSLPTIGTINTEGLKIALHIRLNYELSLEERCIPIVILTDFNLDILIAKNI